MVIDTRTLEGTIDLVGVDAATGADVAADAEIAARPMRGDLAPDPELPAATRVWAALQQVSGGTWGGCVYDADAIVRHLDAGRAAVSRDWAAGSPDQRPTTSDQRPAPTTSDQRTKDPARSP